LVILGGALVLTGSVRGDGFVPDEAARRMALPEGFAAQVFASEPDIRQPVATCFDERGRLWVIEYLQYPNPAGLKPVRVDVYLRTEYDRVPEPPPHGPRGLDRVKILEDTDGDGRADKITTFVEGLNLASGLAVGHGGLFVAQAPYLLFYPDRNRDDRPDGDPEVLLKGFGLQDAHAVVNSLAWGPDGWLYGAQGSTVTANIQGQEFQQGIWRYHPRTRVFELFAEGGGNTWGLDFDRQGNAFGSSNGGFITFHMVQGGYYWKGFTKHGPLHNPRAYGYFDSIAYEGPKLGGHVTPGGIIYKADAYPQEFRGAFLGGNLLSNAVYWHTLRANRSTFAGRHGGTLIDARDRWFRPIDLLTGPDGCVYVVDWYDKRASHLDPRDNWDKTNGRIYRLTYQGTKAVRPGDLATWTSQRLLALRDHANDWFPDMARRLLAERRDPSVIPTLKAWLADDRDETIALRDLWALSVSGGLDDATALTSLDHPVPGVRAWTIRLLADEHRISPAFQARLEALARSDPAPAVRSQLASSCQRWPVAAALPILEGLMARDEDETDPHIPLLIWWALERHLRDDPSKVVDRLAQAEIQRRSLVRSHLLERVARALASFQSEADWARLARLLDAAPGDAEVERLVAGVEKGLEGRVLDRVPVPLKAFLARWTTRSPESLGSLKLAARLGDLAALRQASDRLVATETPETDRLALIDLVAQVKTTESSRSLLALFLTNPSRAVRLAALNALGGFEDPRLASALTRAYPQLEPDLRDRLRNLLTQRVRWAEALVDAIEQGVIPPRDLSASQARQVAGLGDSALTARLEAAWGKVPDPSAEAQAQARRIAEVRGILVEGDKGRAERGREVFLKHCAGCHRLFQDGANIGPDLTGAERNLDALLQNIVNPSGMIRKEYQAQVLALKDGRVLTGLVVEESGSALTLFDAQQQKTVIPAEQIEERKASEASLMPEGLIDPLPDEQVRDLFKYLQSSGPPR
jgi:putative membrane-bound dehydrogenase-like protein